MKWLEIPMFLPTFQAACCFRPRANSKIQAVCLSIGFLLMTADLPNKTYAKQEGPGRGVEITTQLLGGYLASGIVVGTLGYALNPSKAGSEIGEQLVGLLFEIGATPMIILASSGSAYGIGQAWGHRKGSFWKTLLGASVPPLLGAIAGAASRQSVVRGYGDVVLIIDGAFLGSLFSPVGAIAGYHLSSSQPQKSAAMRLGEHRSPRWADDCPAVVVPLLQIRF